MPRVKKNIRNEKTVKTGEPVKSAKSSKILQGNTDSLKNIKQNILDQIRLSESYVSLILGAAVVLVLSLVFFVFIKGNNSSKNTLPATDSINPLVTKAVDQTYILSQDESLWDVAVKFYGDGFRWTDIAKANNLEETADFVPPGTKLIIPNAK